MGDDNPFHSSSPSTSRRRSSSAQTTVLLSPVVSVLPLLLLFTIIHFGSVRTYGHPQEFLRVARGFGGAVASDEGRCSAIGKKTLQRGGNAVDATVATVLCLGVVNPMASGIGGGAFLLLRMANGQAQAFDMREVAPAAASENMYANDSDSQIKGALSIAVPGEVAGLYLVWQQHGRLPWASLFKPAIKLAEKGFVVRPYLASSINSSAAAILADVGLSEVFAPNGTLLGAGDICYRKTLAKTLKTIAREGPSAFYTGDVGEKLVADVQKAGGILTMEDLREYRVTVRPPMEEDILGLTVLGMPPPSSGGPCLILILNILAAYQEPYRAIMGSLGLHRTIEAFKHAYAVRMNLGDPDFVNITDVLADMRSPSFASSLQKQISDNQTFPPDYYGGRWNQLNDHGTSHLNIVDGERNAVSITSTVNYPFGSKILSQSTGIVLNNEMGDFSIPTSDPETTLPNKANFIEPGKRPLSSMAPTIVLQDGQLLGVVGGSGGIKIITTTAQVFLNQFWKGWKPLSSVTHPRVHHQLIPNTVDYENWTTVSGDHIELKETLVDSLRRRGHNVEGTTGAVSQLILHNIYKGTIALPHHAILDSAYKKDTYFGELTAVSDPRKDGSPAAF